MPVLELYTLWAIKTGHYVIGDNFIKCEPTFTTFAPLGRKSNFQQNPCNTSNFTLTLAHIFPPNMVTYRSNPQKDHPCMETHRLSHKA